MKGGRALPSPRDGAEWLATVSDKPGKEVEFGPFKWAGGVLKGLVEGVLEAQAGVRAGGADPTADHVSLMLALVQKVKGCEDVVSGSTRSLHLVADVAFTALRGFVLSQAAYKAYPGVILLPTTLFGNSK